MKILFIGHEEELNGASKSLLNIINELEKQHEIFVLTAKDSGAFYEALKRCNVRILSFPYYRWCVLKSGEKNWIKRQIKWRVYQQYVNKSSAKKIAQIVKKEKIDIIHSNSSVINIGGLIQKYSGVPHVWHLREFGDMDFDMYPLMSEKKYYHFMNQYAQKFICISKAVFNHYKYLDVEKKVVIYNGIDKSYLLKFQREYSNTIQFVISGRISKAKGQQYAIDACKELLNRDLTNFHLYICGAGKLKYSIPEQLRPYITVLGLVKDMQKLRKKMDVELVCSKAEAFGRVTAEAMMAGMPVIGSDTGGTTELIQNGKTGFLYNADNVLKLADCMGKFMQDSSLMKKMGIQARLYAQKNFTIERCVAEILVEYDKIIKR